ncbi:MAG: arylesterase [Desulfobulbaceae bacterium]|nr:arylesterase [Desulfobulbaceae bacterium]
MKNKTGWVQYFSFFHYPLAFLFLLSVIMMGCDGQDEKYEPVRHEKITYDGTIIAAGDSLTAGYGVMEYEAYPILLEKKLQKNGYNWQVINAGVSGETSSGMLSRIQWIIGRHPDIVILETGANDGLRGIPISVISANIKKAVEQLQQAEIVVVLAGMQVVQNLGEDYNHDFASLYPAIAKKYETIFIPFFLKEVGGEPSLNQADTIHPTAEGYKIITDVLYPYVVEAIAAAKR